MSKDFEKFIIKQSVCLSASIFRVMSSTHSINWVSHDRPFGIHAVADRGYCVSACFIIWLVMMCSINLHAIHVSEFGL